MADVLIVYATKHGQTEKVARHMAATLASKGHRAELVDANHPPPRLDLARFELAVVGGPIHAGGYPRSLVRFAREHRQFLDSIPSAFFSVGLAVQSRTSDGRAQTLEVVDAFIERTGWRPQRVELIAGALRYSRYNFLIRYVMRRIVAREGGDTDTSRDYEYTDFEAVARFASGLIEEPMSQRRPTLGARRAALASS